MHRRLRWKLIGILTLVVGTSAFAWLPPLAERFGLALPSAVADRRLSLGLDLRGGVQFVLRVNADEALAMDAAVTRDEVVARAREAVDRRVNALGVVEPVIAVQGERGDEIVVQLPGFTDVERARALLATSRTTSIAPCAWKCVLSETPTG
jgi:preprotein translocase subunit SecD